MRPVRIQCFGGSDVMAIEKMTSYPRHQRSSDPIPRSKALMIAAAGDDVSIFLVSDVVSALLSPEHGGYEEFVLAKSNVVVSSGGPTALVSD
jgi:hypothetical protein